jgi:hypothetical protein
MAYIPKRIQRKRTKGWRMPGGAIYVGRPGKWGNPFVIGGYYMKGDPDIHYRAPFRFVFTQTTKEYADDRYTRIDTPEQALEWFRWYIEKYPKQLNELRGKDLACWCRLDEPCHADVLLELANK